jgi:hypothetical protein
MLMTIASLAGARGDWRRRMRGELWWIFLVKLAALTLLWVLFFSAAHHAVIDGQSVSRQLGVAPPAAPSGSPAAISNQEISRG